MELFYQAERYNYVILIEKLLIGVHINETEFWPSCFLRLNVRLSSAGEWERIYS